MATHSSILAWKTPRTEELEVYSPWGHKESDTTERLTLNNNTPLEKEMATHSRFLPGKSHGQRSLVGYSPWGHKESDTTEPLSLRYIPETVARCFSLYIHIHTHNVYYFLAAPSNMQDLCSPTRDRTQAPSLEARSHSHQTTRELLLGAFLLLLVYTVFLHDDCTQSHFIASKSI